MSQLISTYRMFLTIAASAVVVSENCRADDKTVDLPGIEFGAAKLECKLTLKPNSEVCATGKLKAKLAGKDVDGDLAGAELCGKKLAGGGLKITGEADAGKLKNFQGNEVKAFESKVEVQWKDGKVTKGKASVVVATGKAPEKGYFSFDGKKFTKVDEKQYDKIDCEK